MLYVRFSKFDSISQSPSRRCCLFLFLREVYRRPIDGLSARAWWTMKARERKTKKTRCWLRLNADRRKMSRVSRKQASLLDEWMRSTIFLDESLRKIHVIKQAIEEKNCCCRFQILLRHFRQVKERMVYGLKNLFELIENTDSRSKQSLGRNGTPVIGASLRSIYTFFDNEAPSFSNLSHFVVFCSWPACSMFFCLCR